MQVDAKKAFQLIFFFGLISLFGDIIYEGARSVNGPYLKELGANAAAVGIIAGLGEFLGYAIRLISGYFSDRTKAYWLFVFVGYGMLISVPLLSMTGAWQLAALLIVVERVGKALRGPARDTIISQAAKQIGTGLGFGIAEAMDQIGAMAGPLIFSGLFFFTGAATKGVRDYQNGYNLLWAPFILLLICVSMAYLRFPNPRQFEPRDIKEEKSSKLSKLFWLYSAFTFVTTLGFVNFFILGYHFKAKGVFVDAMIPFMYAVAMAVDGIAALVIGKLYDTRGLVVLIIIPVLSIAGALFAFSGQTSAAVLSMIIWGIVMGAHETVMRSAVADLTPSSKRGTGYGIFNAAYGIAVFIGSAVMGIFYERSLLLLISGIVAVEIAAVILFFIMRKEAQRSVLMTQAPLKASNL